MNCRHCKTDKTVRCGFRTTKERGRVQRYKCLNCHRTFAEDSGFLGRHKSEETILMVIELYIKGLTTRQLADSFSISKNTVLAWVLFYAHCLLRFCIRHTPKYARHLHMDELFLKMKDTFFYIWASLDRDCKWAVLHFCSRRTRDEAQNLAQKSPTPLIDLTTDGSFAYLEPVKAEYGLGWTKEHYHRCASFEDKKNNNPVERLNNTIRRHFHPRRGFKSLRTGILQVGFLNVYYNFVRRHMTIEKTPAEAAGVWSWPPKISEREKLRQLIKASSLFLLAAINRILGQSPRKSALIAAFCSKAASIALFFRKRALIASFIQLGMIISVLA